VGFDTGADGLQHIRDYEKMLQVVPEQEQLYRKQPMDAYGNIIMPQETLDGGMM